VSRPSAALSNRHTAVDLEHLNEADHDGYYLVGLDVYKETIAVALIATAKAAYALHGVCKKLSSNNQSAPSASVAATTLSYAADRAGAGSG
jgi:hypothetical protein